MQRSKLQTEIDNYTFLFRLTIQLCRNDKTVLYYTLYSYFKSIYRDKIEYTLQIAFAYQKCGRRKKFEYSYNAYFSIGVNGIRKPIFTVVSNFFHFLYVKVEEVGKVYTFN